MKVLELFSGTHSVGVVCKEKGLDVTSLDRDLGSKSKLYNYESINHIQEDIMTFDYKKHFKEGEFDLVTASPVCAWWSIMRKCTCSKEKIENDINLYGKPMVDKVIDIINYLKPKFYWIENPYTGLMKKYIKDKYPDIHLKNYVVDYCQYDDNIGYQKRTIFWTNIPNLNPKLCKGQGKCNNMNGTRHRINIAAHQYVFDKGKKIMVNTKELREKYKDFEIHKQDTTKNRYDRYKIPFSLIEELIDKCIDTNPYSE